MPLAGIVGFFALLLFAYCQGQQHGKASDAVQHAQQAVKVADSVRVVVHDTVTVRERQKARIDTLVRVASETTVVVRQTPAAKPETLTVNRLIPQRFAADDSLIAGLHVELGAANQQIVRRDWLLKLPRARAHWGLGIGGGYACNNKGCGPGLAIGLTWRW